MHQKGSPIQVLGKYFEVYGQNSPITPEARKKWLLFGFILLLKRLVPEFYVVKMQNGRMKPKYFSVFSCHTTTLLEPVFRSEKFDEIEGTLMFAFYSVSILLKLLK